MAHEQLENARAAVRRAIVVLDDEAEPDVRDALVSLDETLASLDQIEAARREDQLVLIKQLLNQVRDDVIGECGSHIDRAWNSIVAYERIAT